MNSANSPRPIVFWGATGQCLVLEELVTCLGYSLVALVDRNPALVSPYPQVPLFADENAFRVWRDQQSGPLYGLVAVGGTHGGVRLELQARLMELGLEIPVAIHPRAQVSPSAQVGFGGQILAGANVAARARLGRAVIINHLANVDHECELGDGVHLAPGATLCGCVQVEDHAFIGAGAVVLPRRRIGRGAVIGAGAVVTRDVPPGTTVRGNPAR